MIDKVAIQKDILYGKLAGIEISNEDREEIQQELDFVKNDWAIERNQGGIGQCKRPLLTSTEWIQIQAR